jgi:6-phosphogluconolactonase
MAENTLQIKNRNFAMGKIIMLTLFLSQTLSAQTYDVYFGTYTKNSPSDGIYHAQFQSEKGKLSTPEIAAKISNPSFVVIHPNGKYLYSVIEGNPGKVAAFAIDQKSKKLKFLNQAPSGGKVPCHVSITKNGKILLVANYSSGSLASIPINDDGTLQEPASIIFHKGSSIAGRRQRGAHTHSINLSPDQRFVYVADLGIDKIMIYRLNPDTGKLTENTPASLAIKPGAGPRHFTFHPNGKFAYVINELDNTLIILKYTSETGALTKIQTISTLPQGFKGKSYTAEVRVHPNGKFIYGSNRGHDSIVTYKISPNSGILTLIGFQKEGISNPRHFNIDPSGKFCLVANQNSNNVGVFSIDQKNGMLKPPHQTVSIGKPVCIKFLTK